ncbi:MAG: hypothetical protein QM527_15410 [Alphaproteobacteria bacterium]|nr:hypothetical protein [Alphaproteobacteria bacterium]
MWVSGDSKYLYVNDLGGSVIKAYAISSSGHLTKIGSDITMPTTPVTGTPTTQGLAGF